MSLQPARPRYTVVALAMLMLACGRDSTAPDGAAQEAVVVSLVGISADHAGIVLRLTGSVEGVEAARGSLDVAWARDEKDQTTVVIVGRLFEGSDVLLVRRVAGVVPLRAQMVEVAATDGGVSSPSSILATVRVRDAR
jgi:hypothetical protein